MATNRSHRRVPWNKDKIVGQKAPLKLREIWAIRVQLQLRSNLRDSTFTESALAVRLHRRRHGRLQDQIHQLRDHVPFVLLFQCLQL